MTDADPIEVRSSSAADGDWAEAAAELVGAAAADHDIAVREVEFLRKKVVTGRAALAFRQGELVGFGYWSEWEEGRFISHSGLIVRPDCRGTGLARRVKTVMFESSQARFPAANLMSLTSSPAVQALNASLGFRTVPLDRLTVDPEFWKGCETCRNYAEVQAREMKCCCEGMLLQPSKEAEDERS